MSWESIESGCIYYYDFRWFAIALRNVFQFFDKKNPARMSWESIESGCIYYYDFRWFAIALRNVSLFSTKKIQPV